MGLSAVVYKSASALEKEFPGYHFRCEPTSGECEVIYPDGARIPQDTVTACERRFGNISHIGVLRETIFGYLGKGSALERLVLYSGSHAGDVIKGASFDDLEGELRLIESSPEAVVREFADELLALISMARLEQNPIVFV
ncbi:hypothetical protein [Mesorhizobium sp. M1348]|uniref:hypothetical protein n=1 Tax=unclassified Mesorhizobium TaxID=325217 RepID=UPI00333B6C5C